MNTKQAVATQLDQLKEMTTIVADTGDFQSMAIYKPTDATTNPSLILKACLDPKFKHLIDKAIYATQSIPSNERLSQTIDKIFVNFGLEILKIVPGRVSIEVDARLSFDKEKSIEKARHIISLFEEHNIPRERILIKLASTWEGIEAAKVLEKENIHCNMTLLFDLSQAIACALANVTLISPFVGRILDWYKKFENKNSYPANEDPGVVSVTNIFHYYKKFGYKTEIMGASFRNIEEIIELAGCDLLTISPNLLEELKQSDKPIVKKLDNTLSKDLGIDKIDLDEKSFRYMLNMSAMATEKLSDGIRLFVKDLVKLETIIQELI